MDILTEIYEWLRRGSEIPQKYGSYHMLCIGITLGFALLLILLFRNCSDGFARGLIFAFWLVIFVLEIGKQLGFGFKIVDGEFQNYYSWGVFPFQFCSTPLYIMPIAALARDGKLRDSALVFLICFAAVGGITVYVFPDSVFCGSAFLNVQTMIHHGTQIFIALFLGVRYRSKLNLENYLLAGTMFISLAAIALGLNIAQHELFPILNISGSFNLFFISPYERYLPSALAGFGLESAPYYVILTGYIAAVFLGAGLMLFVCRLIGLFAPSDADDEL